MKLSVRSPDELVAVVPHLLGFVPQESLTIVPLSRELPVARIDLPSSAREREHAWEAISDVYSRHAQPGSAVALIAFADDRGHADRLGQDFVLRLGAIGIATPIRLWASDTQWTDLNTGDSGPLTQQVRDSIAARTILNGMAQPAASRDSLAASLIGDHAPIAGLLPEARAAAARNTVGVEGGFVLNRLNTFHSDGNRLTDADAARFVVALESVPIRDEVWDDMAVENATSHVALWSDLTRRAPDQVRAAPATMLAFAGWLNGNGALAWCALDQVPQGQRYPAAEIVTALVENGAHPSIWERVKAAAAGSVDEHLASSPPRLSTQPTQRPPAI